MRTIMIMVLFFLTAGFAKSQTTVTLHLADNCNTSDVRVLPKNTEGSLQIYPNPNTGAFDLVLSADEKIGTATITVYNTSALSVYSERIYSSSGKLVKKLNLPKIADGTYILEVRSEKKVYKTKLIVKN